MPTYRKDAATSPAPTRTVKGKADLESLSRETGVPVDVLRTFAGISDPTNEHMFTAESARRALVDVKARRDRT